LQGQSVHFVVEINIKVFKHLTAFKHFIQVRSDICVKNNECFKNMKHLAAKSTQGVSSVQYNTAVSDFI